MTADERPPTANELPDGWVWTTLGDICEPIVQVNPRETMPDRPIKYVDISSVDNEKNAIVEHKEILGSEAPSRARKPIHANDILFATVRTYLRNVAMVPPGYDGEIASTGFCVLRPISGIESHFIYRYLLTDEFIQRISEKQRGISYPAVTDRDVYAESIPLPPEAEQRRIVARIEALLAQSRRGREALEGIPDLLARLRKAVLTRAFRGELTGRDPDDEPASVLLERIRAERRRRWEENLRAQGKDPRRYTYEEPAPPDTSDLPELPEGWVWTSVDELSDVVRGASPRPAGDPRYFGGNIPWITVGCLTADSHPYLYSAPTFVTEAGKEKSRYIEPETLLLTNSGATLGVPKITKMGGCINDGIVALLHVDYPLKLYLYYCLQTLTEQLRAIKQGAAQPNLNTSIVRAIEIPLAPLAEQRRIVARIEALFAQADRLEAAVAAIRRRLEQVDQAVLARTFRGELVSQDPSDEPASVLLERIQQEQKGNRKESTHQMLLPGT